MDWEERSQSKFHLMDVYPTDGCECPVLCESYDICQLKLSSRVCLTSPNHQVQACAVPALLIAKLKAAWTTLICQMLREQLCADLSIIVDSPRACKKHISRSDMSELIVMLRRRGAGTHANQGTQPNQG